MSESVNASPAAAAAPATTQTPAAPAAVAAQAQQAARMLKLKVDGQDLELSESEVIALAQQGRSASKRFQEAAATKREAEQIVNYLKSNPKEAFKKLGIDVRKFSEDTLMELIQHDKMTPEQKEAHQAKLDLKKYRDQESAAKEKAKKDQDSALEQQHMKTFDETFTQALSEKGLPKTPFTIVRMAQLTIAANKKGLNMPASELAKIVREDYQRDQSALLEGLEGDDLLSFLGKEALKRISKAQLSKYKAKGAVPAVRQAQSKPSENGEKPVSTWKQFTKRNRGF